ncbi:hypothetical protein COS66_02805 [Candidatus Berkelbacteria bacterium CG06_land_8_20_14_3_00_43_10]|uniref:PEGA domain-containing protein n=1 Tax=Candidatus Berkelbacteria bacterium CG10_big_fil_rev_8_21_14_0_10_43_14 TaxID=1974515 RepID=A0A2M6R9M8_9BACT|nr:MAG: hypothetical protein AUK41_01290 [Candidatus Berkelbacteria bacterium CG2_30_43_20]PIS06770.1 MAG: hypothetical protein COT79_02920 [Candidatus Berkelbacteria bacterium CG10_big_fil_rev_8_21_14_0_10_43_14]PIU87089.1 MAG: hypothetical protein COS66_02805 [Candidatus Berkelbacteria bacterium CG06_land_8_20_14_3_00_43_10]
MALKLHTKLKFFILWSVLLISFGMLSVYLILSASGYHIDWKWFRIEKTGIITIKSQPRDVSVFVDASLLASSTPVALRNMLPGSYDITINKPEYHDWSKTIQVDSGRVTDLSDVLLLRLNPVVETISVKEMQLLDNYTQNNDILISGNEIYRNEKSPQLVTRLSRDVVQAVFYPDKRHIVFQVGNEIKSMDLLGQNVQAITQLPTDKQSRIIFIDSGTSILIKQEEAYSKFKIG